MPEKVEPGNNGGREDGSSRELSELNREVSAKLEMAEIGSVAHIAFCDLIRERDLQGLVSQLANMSKLSPEDISLLRISEMELALRKQQILTRKDEIKGYDAERKYFQHVIIDELPSAVAVIEEEKYKDDREAKQQLENLQRARVQDGWLKIVKNKVS